MAEREGYKVISQMSYQPRKVERGYTNQTLYVNIGTGKIEARPVTEMMKEKFIGGRGFGLWRLWNAVTKDTKWNDPENEIVIGAGPIGGITTYPGAGKSLVVSLSPTTGSVIDSNVGGYFGPYLKFSGWDSLEIQGKSDKDVIVFIDGDARTVEILESTETDVNTHVLAEKLLYQFAESDSPKDLLAISTVSAGTGAEHSYIGCLNFSYFDMKRKVPRIKQAGRGGIGTVFRDKGIAALVVKFTGVKPDSNGPADMERIRKAGERINKEILELDSSQNDMRHVGTSHLVEIMDEFDLLPVTNYRFGSHPDAKKISSDVWREKFTQGMPDGCWLGCTMSCSHAVDNFELRTGPYKGDHVVVDGPEYETAGGSANMGIFEPEFVLTFEDTGEFVPNVLCSVRDRGEVKALLLSNRDRYAKKVRLRAPPLAGRWKARFFGSAGEKELGTNDGKTGWAFELRGGETSLVLLEEIGSPERRKAR